MYPIIKVLELSWRMTWPGQNMLMKQFIKQTKFLAYVGSKNKDIFSIFYKSYVWPILEYASLVWSPHLAKDIHEIEKVQRRASRITLGQRKQEMAYEDRCKILKWNSLERSREFLSLVECYKIVFNLNGLNFSDYFELCKSTKTRSNHQYKIQTKLAKSNCH